MKNWQKLRMIWFITVIILILSVCSSENKIENIPSTSKQGVKEQAEKTDNESSTHGEPLSDTQLFPFIKNGN